MKIMEAYRYATTPTRQVILIITIATTITQRIITAKSVSQFSAITMAIVNYFDCLFLTCGSNG